MTTHSSDVMGGFGMGLDLARRQNDPLNAFPTGHTTGRTGSAHPVVGESRGVSR